LTWIDVFPVVLLILYGVGGYFAGLVRRFIGLAALFVACWAATNMGLQAGGILQQSSNFETADARIYGFFGILLAMLIVVEVATQIAHRQIQIPAVVLNRTLGTILGVLTAILLSVIVIYELEAASNPLGGGQLTGVELGLRTAIHDSLFMVRIADAINKPIIDIFSPVLPGDPQVYFGPGPVS
jgi:hypothetical protein